MKTRTVPIYKAEYLSFKVTKCGLFLLRLQKISVLYFYVIM